MSPQYTGRRFPYREAVWDNPSPTAYDPKIQTKKCRPVERKRGVGNLFLCPVPMTYGESAPSIPTKIDENGYLIGEDEELIKIPPTEHDQSLGPAYYEVPQVNNRVLL